jgi:ABC-type sugar transport system permease subunit
MPAQGRTATRPPVTPPAQRPRPPAGPVRRDGPTADGAEPAAPLKRKQQIVRGVRSRRLVRRLDIWSVFRVSVVFYACVFIVMMIAGIALWNVAAAFGVITDGEKLVRSLFALTTFVLHPITALFWGAIIAGAICFLGVLFNVFAAVVYNLISDVAGGVQVVVVSDQGQEESV